MVPIAEEEALSIGMLRYERHLHADPSALPRAARLPDLLARYAQAGCQRVYLWPLGEEQRQLELVASEVAPMIAANGGGGRLK